MKIGVLKEAKQGENRVGLTPSGVKELVKNNHEVLVQFDAGIHSGFTNEEYAAAGAKIVKDAKSVWAQDLVLKVKEPLPEEYHFLHEGLTLFSFLHLAAIPELTEIILKNKVNAIAYETVQLPNGRLPLLTPMSEIAGRRSVTFGATLLEKTNQGSGTLLSGIPGVAKTNVVIIGGGTAGYNAAQLAVGLQANVTLLEINEERIRFLDQALNNRCQILKSTSDNIEKAVLNADLVISTIAMPGAKANKVVTEATVKGMKEGSVIIDISIDQGGTIETIKPTSHEHPTFVKHGVVHSAIPNIPGAVAKTATLALINATLPYILEIANSGIKVAVAKKPELKLGINCYNGSVTLPSIAQALSLTAETLEF